MSTSSRIPFGGETGRKRYADKPRIEPKTSCSFCYFVLSLYPYLTGMSNNDADTFSTHLRQVHGLAAEIQP